jgi:hypothetical protein
MLQDTRDIPQFDLQGVRVCGPCAKKLHTDICIADAEKRHTEQVLQGPEPLHPALTATEKADLQKAVALSLAAQRKAALAKPESTTYRKMASVDTGKFQVGTRANLVDPNVNGWFVHAACPDDGVSGRGVICISPRAPVERVTSIEEAALVDQTTVTFKTKNFSKYRIGFKASFHDRYMSKYNGWYVLRAAGRQPDLVTITKYPPAEWATKGLDSAIKVETDMRQLQLDLLGAQTSDVDICISLGWATTDDLDLHVICPGGEHIHHGNSGTETAGGMLDVDMNASAVYKDRYYLDDPALPAVENVRFKKGKAPHGKYRAYVRNYVYRSTAQGQPIPCHLRLLVDDVEKQAWKEFAIAGEKAGSDEIVFEFDYPWSLPPNRFAEEVACSYKSCSSP